MPQENWTGVLRFDRPRHRDYVGLPHNYARINEFPEWYPIDGMKGYVVDFGGRRTTRLGAELQRGLALSIKKRHRPELRVWPLRKGTGEQ